MLDDNSNIVEQNTMSNIKAKAILKRAKKVIPRAAQTMSKAYSMWIMDDVFPIFVDSSDDCVITSVDGHKFIDMFGGLGTNFFPASHKAVQKAIIKQVKKGINFSLPTTLETELAELLCEIYPCCEQVKFAKNGSDAVSAVIRVARSYSKKDYILTILGGYHGWSDSVAAASQRNEGIPDVFGSFVDKIPYNDLCELEEALKTQKYACLLMEPVSLEEPHEGYLRGVRTLCDKYKTILIFDEVITGSRWALGGAQEYYNIMPDIATIGKGMGAGAPISAIIGKEEYMREFNHIFFSATYFGETISLAASIAVLKELKKHEKKIYKHVWTQGNRIKKTFNSTCKKLGIDAHTIGMAPRITFKFNCEDEIGARDLFLQQMIHRGVFSGVAMLVGWNTKKKHINKVVKVMCESLEIVAHAVKTNTIDNYLYGQRSMVIFRREGDNK